MKFEKQIISDLAINGGNPLFKQSIPVGRPNIGNRKQLNKYFNEILDNKWLTNNGPFVQKFERSIENYLGVKNCISTCNATIGLELVIKALNLTGEIIMPSFTFVATAHAAQWQGLTPIFCDIDPVTHNIDPNKIEDLITSNTSGIIGVHLWGRPCDVELLCNIAYKHNLKLIFDAAHAFGCSYHGEMIGSFGDAEVFSFHATKFLNTFEGGAIVTNNDQLAYKIRLMKNFGFSGNDNVVSVGINGKMNELSAAMGLVGIDSIDHFIDINFKNYQEYRTRLNNISGITVIDYNFNERCNYQYIVSEIDKNITHISRDKILDILQKENILARRYFYPGCHNMEPYKTLNSNDQVRLVETEKLIKKVLIIPTGMSVTENDIKKICNLIKFIIKNGELL